MTSTITVDELIGLGPNGCTVINVGKHAGAREIRGAVRYRPNDLRVASHLVLPLPTDRPIVLYDEDGSAKHLDEIGAKFADSGFADVRILEGGFKAYAQTDAPTQEASTEQTVPPTKAQEVSSLDHRF